MFQFFAVVASSDILCCGFVCVVVLSLWFDGYVVAVGFESVLISVVYVFLMV